MTLEVNLVRTIPYAKFIQKGKFLLVPELSLRFTSSFV